MKTFQQTVILVLAAVTNVLAAPAAEINEAEGAMKMVERGITWAGDSPSVAALTPRGSAPLGTPCTVGKGQCGSGTGCFGCKGHAPVCQPGPGSDICCFVPDGVISPIGTCEDL